MSSTRAGTSFGHHCNGYHIPRVLLGLPRMYPFPNKSDESPARLVICDCSKGPSAVLALANRPCVNQKCSQRSALAHQTQKWPTRTLGVCLTLETWDGQEAGWGFSFCFSPDPRYLLRGFYFEIKHDFSPRTMTPQVLFQEGRLAQMSLRHLRVVLRSKGVPMFVS